MQLSYSQLESHLIKTLSPIYLIQGEELFLKQEVRQLIYKAAKKLGFQEHIRLTSDALTDNQQLYSLLYNHSLLAEKRFIELLFRDTLPNKNASDILQNYADQYPIQNPNQILLIEIGKRDEKIAKSAWYRSLEKKATIIPIWPLTHDQLPTWIAKRAKKYKLALDASAIHFLIDYVEGNLLAAAQALEKIYLFQPEEKVSIELLKTILINESRFTVFEFVDFFMVGNMKKAITTLKTLRHEGIEPTLILWAITRELRLLIECSNSLNAGESYEVLFKKHKIFAKRQATIRTSLQQFTQEQLKTILLKADQIDPIIKGATSLNVWDSLELLCLRMV